MAAGKLSVLKVKSLTKPGTYGDGGNLYLQVRAPAKAIEGAAPYRSWIFRYMVDGTSHDMGLGPLDDVSLAEARDAAHTARKLLREGIDPLTHRDARRVANKAAEPAKTFKTVAGLYIDGREGGWKNEKHRQQWRTTLEQHAYPTIGEKPVDRITTGDVMEVLEPIWRTIPETATRLRGRIEKVLEYAKTMEWRSGDNPARWNGHVENVLPRRNEVRAVKHQPALPWQHIGAFMVALRAKKGVAAQALTFGILTAARSGEVRGATWREMDLQAATWTIPRERMKGKRQHRVPLSKPALAILESRKGMSTGPDGLVFFGSDPKKPLSDMALSMLVRGMNEVPEGGEPRWCDAVGAPIVPHGFRSVFRDWAGEATAYPREVAEMALAHALKDKTEAAYARSDLFEKRARMMTDWAMFCCRPAASGEVVSIRGTA